MAFTAEQARIRDGCRCKECFGLAEHMLLSTGRDFGLPRAPRPHDPTSRLHVVTAGPSNGITFTGPLQDEKPCTGGMLCACKRCSAEIAARVQQGGKGAGAQPWTPRAARQAA
jgi:hypothetical protein